MSDDDILGKLNRAVEIADGFEPTPKETKKIETKNTRSTLQEDISNLRNEELPNWPFRKSGVKTSRFHKEIMDNRVEQAKDMLELRRLESAELEIRHDEDHLLRRLDRAEEFAEEMHKTNLSAQKLALRRNQLDYQLTKKAEAQGLDLAQYKQLRDNQEQADIDVYKEHIKSWIKQDEIDQLGKLRIEELRELSRLKIEEEQASNGKEIELYKAKKEIDSSHNLHEMRERVRLALLAKNLSKYQEISLLIEVMDRINEEIAEIAYSNRDDFIKGRMIDAREKYLRILEQDLYERGQRLLETNNGGNIRADNKDTDIRGNSNLSMEAKPKRVSNKKPWRR